MHFNHIDCTILGTIHHGQVIVVDLMHWSLRVLFAKLARHLGSWRAPVRLPGAMKPATATCPSYSALRRQRQQRWLPSVVETRGAVGVR